MPISDGEEAIMSRCIPFQKMIADGQAEEAIVGLLQEFIRDPEYFGAIYNLALAFKALGRCSLARDTFTLYLELAPDGYWASQARSELLE